MKDFLLKLSFTNVVLTALILNLLITQSWVAALAVVPAFLSFMAEEWCRKKMITNEALERIKALDEKLKSVFDHARDTRSKVDLLQSNSEAITKLAADTKKLVSEGNLAGAFIPRAKRQQAS